MKHVAQSGSEPPRTISPLPLFPDHNHWLPQPLPLSGTALFKTTLSRFVPGCASAPDSDFNSIVQTKAYTTTHTARPHKAKTLEEKLHECCHRSLLPTYHAEACQDYAANGDINAVYDGNEQSNEKVDDPKSRYKKVEQRTKSQPYPPGSYNSSRDLTASPTTHEYGARPAHASTNQET